MDRRTFLAAGATTSAALVLPGRLGAAPRVAPRQSASAMLPAFGDATLPDDANFIHIALDAARAVTRSVTRSAGVTYADVQRRHVQTEEWSFGALESLRHESGLAVRVFVNGCWGCATVGGIGTADDAARLGRDAAERALIAAATRPSATPHAELAPIGAAASGSWVMPGTDPFTVTFEEKSNFVDALRQFTHQIPIGEGTLPISLSFRRERRVFGSSDGAFTTQIVYLVNANVPYSSRATRDIAYAVVPAPFVTPTGAGWEYIRGIPARAEGEAMLEFVMRARDEREVDVGRYDLVFDAISAGNLIAATIGPATELPRAMGYYADTEGTSYLTDPLTMLLDQARVASPLVTLTTDRTMPEGAATVRWDDEGVTPIDTPIIRHGVLSGFQTTRESAAWMGSTARSTGCAGMFGATTPTGQVSPNMVLQPGANTNTMMDLVKGVKKGLLVYGATFSSDHQFLNGSGRNTGAVFEINNGVVGSAMKNVKLLYRSPEFWSHVDALGGPASARPVGIESRRGDASTGSAYHTVRAVPMLITGAAVTNEWHPRERRP